MNILDEFVCRTPLFSVDEQIDINNDYFLEAIYLASPILYFEILKFKKGEISEARQLSKMESTLYKYFTRSKYRCTPFGLFAGLSIGKWAESSQIIFPSDLKNCINRRSRLDMDVISNLYKKIANEFTVKNSTKFFLNNSIYNIGDYYRYVEYTYLKNKRSYKLIKVDQSDHLEFVFSNCKNGLRRLEIISLLTENSAAEEDAIEFVDTLIETQLLISDLEPSLTEDSLSQLIFQLNAINQHKDNAYINEVIPRLLKIRSLLEELDHNLINPVSIYQEIEFELKHFLPEFDGTDAIQTDFFKKASVCNLKSDIKTDIRGALNFLNKILPSQKNQSLETFKKNFLARFEDSEVPLLLALDGECGIGYSAHGGTGINELIDDLFFDSKNDEYQIHWNSYQESIFNLLRKVEAQKLKVIRISEKDFPNIDYSNDRMPFSIAAMFRIVDKDQNKIALTTAGGSSAINMLGRFGFGDKNISALCEKIARHEESMFHEALVAQIIHCPEGRTGNVLSHPPFWSHEIPYLTKSSAVEPNQIDVHDLVVSVRQNKVILKSSRLNKEIIPRLSNAHNFRNNSLPVYHFLCDLQSQYFEKTYFRFDWGALEHKFTFLPRVEYEKVILSPAKWMFKAQDYEHFIRKDLSSDEKKEKLVEFLSKHELPNSFFFVEGDNELLINTSDDRSMSTFLDIISKRSAIYLEEFLYADSSYLITDDRGRGFANEFISIILNSDKQGENSHEVNTCDTEQQFFVIGSEWLYFKIYCGTSTTDDVLVKSLFPILNKLFLDQLIDKWFFVRYADPDNHLRIRLHLVNSSQIGTVILQLTNIWSSLQAQNLISKVQSETYKRELLRYGKNSVEICETIFFLDSICSTRLIQLMKVNSFNHLKWLVALKSTEKYLDDFGFSHSQRCELMNRLAENFFQEHNGNKELRVQIDQSYRTNRKKIENCIEDKSEDEILLAATDLLNERSANLSSSVAKILALYRQNNLQVNLESLVTSLIHMSLNRIFSSQNRKNELLVYQLLSRYYNSLKYRIPSTL